MVVTVRAVDDDRGQQAGAQHLSVDQHAARAAHADAAAFLGARQPEVVAQQVDQAAVGADGYFTRGSVEFEAHDMLVCRRHAPYPTARNKFSRESQACGLGRKSADFRLPKKLVKRGLLRTSRRSGLATAVSDRPGLRVGRR